MAAGFLQHAVFRDAVARAGESWRRSAPQQGAADGPPLLEQLEQGGDLEDTTVAQPLLAALQIAAAELCSGSGLHKPLAAVGHSLGDISAACTAGVLTLDEAMAVVRHRSAVMARCLGAMAAVRASAAKTRGVIVDVGLGDSVSVAASNAAGDSTISGPAEAVQQAVGALKQARVVARPVPVRYAFHSPLLTAEDENTLRTALRGALGPPRPLAAGDTLWYPTGLLTQEELCGGSPAELYAERLAGAQQQGLGADYWAAQVRRPVCFEWAARAARAAAPAAVEVGPRPVVSRYLTAAGFDSVEMSLPVAAAA
eukprot:TRINITY_DN13772_c0_g1_i1.p2 TRINITY_DN13772_c0_g1~~TRINITY_DN13772_c0_g1_i1.p2  ORF type:complete len:359 (+),score=104.41 TRINITY_DN13772_c0_g1_i1:142-1077(+)